MIFAKAGGMAFVPSVSAMSCAGTLMYASSKKVVATVSSALFSLSITITGSQSSRGEFSVSYVGIQDTQLATCCLTLA